MSCECDGSCEFQSPINRPDPQVSEIRRRYALLWVELSEADFEAYVKLKEEEHRKR